MAEILNCKGMKCPQPVLKAAIRSTQLASGTTLEIQADCVTFPEDIRKWCTESGKTLVSVVDQGTHRVATLIV